MEISEDMFRLFLEKKLGIQYEPALQEFRKWHPYWQVDVWNAFHSIASYMSAHAVLDTKAIEVVLCELEKHPYKDNPRNFETLNFFNQTIPHLLKIVCPTGTEKKESVCLRP